MRKHNINRYDVLGALLLPIVLLGALLLLNLLNNLFNQQPVRLPKTGEVVMSVFVTAKNPAVWFALYHTIKISLVATIVAAIIGLAVGFPLAYEKRVWQLCQPSLDMLRSIPVTFLVPPIAIIIGVKSPWLAYLLAFCPAFLFMVLSARQGVIRHDLDRSMAFAFFSGRHNRIERFWKILIPEAMPEIFLGLKLSVSYALVIVTVLEYFDVGPKGGIGEQIRIFYDNVQYAAGFVTIAYVGAVGYILNKVLDLACHRTMHWSQFEIES
jgi:ABC-type nitrate/sulfonate/bicarbonate transport system permease component